MAGIDDFDEGNLGTMTLNNTNNEGTPNANNNNQIRRADTLNGNDQFVPSTSPMPGSFVAGAMAGGGGIVFACVCLCLHVFACVVCVVCLVFGSYFCCFMVLSQISEPALNPNK